MTKILNIFFILFFSIACEKAQPTPQEPIWGKESCGRCRMILSEKRYAVQRILNSGEIVFYDDMNCALLDPRHKDEGKLYVRPFGSDSWITAESARYNSGFQTPMNSGIGAMKNGGILTFKDVQQIVLEKKQVK